MKTTKEIARELGFIRTKSQPRENCSKENSGQKFGFLIVIDFESTCWQDKKFCTQEIIEFPAVLLNTSNGKIESEFHYYVQPQENPILSEFCRQLTGITQEKVDNGIPLHLCLRKFSHWLNTLINTKGLNFDASQAKGYLSNAAFVTWSDWDLGVCLYNECRRKQIQRSQHFNSWIDLRATYRKFYERKPNGLNGALQDLGIEFEGRQHSGIDDARNTAKLVWRMCQDGCKLSITKTLRGKRELPQISPPKSLCTFKSPDCKKRKVGTPSPKAKSGKSTPSKSNTEWSHQTDKDMAEETSPWTKSVSKNRVDITIFKDPLEGDSYVPKSKTNAKKTTKGLKPISSSFQNLKAFTRTEVTPVTSKQSQHFYDKSRFRTPSESHSNETPSATMKKTPPLCICGKRSKRKYVQSPGPNLGRCFFSCSKGGQFSSTKNGCSFFAWETSGIPIAMSDRKVNQSRDILMPQRRSLGVRPTGRPLMLR